MLLPSLHIKHVLHRFQCVYYNILHFLNDLSLPHVVPELLLQVILKLLQTPHVPLNLELSLVILAILCDRVVAQMAVVVADLV